MRCGAIRSSWRSLAEPPGRTDPPRRSLRSALAPRSRTRGPVLRRLLRAPGEREVLHVAQPGRVLEFLVTGLEVIVGDAAVPLAQGDAKFSPRQVRAKATVDAAAEGDVGVLAPIEPHVERVRIGGRIDVGGTVADDNRRSLGHQLTTGQLDILLGHSRDSSGHWRLPTQQLLNGGRDDGGGLDDL